MQRQLPRDGLREVYSAKYELSWGMMFLADAPIKPSFFRLLAGVPALRARCLDMTD